MTRALKVLFKIRIATSSLYNQVLTSRKDPNVLPNTNKTPPTPLRNMIVAMNCRACI